MISKNLLPGQHTKPRHTGTQGHRLLDAHTSLAPTLGTIFLLSWGQETTGTARALWLHCKASDSPETPKGAPSIAPSSGPRVTCARCARASPLSWEYTRSSARQGLQIPMGGREKRASNLPWENTWNSSEVWPWNVFGCPHKDPTALGSEHGKEVERHKS